ncbi:hypothetical protein H8L32_22365 [Undibacterium sp. CY18W]|uniref:Uncharacterized protein n=1 Tax=Undibacterium hunanense TaxID=2762292 RepID=A0ABR6ZWH7_9BURK|nr:hypothetical protein [Undibacterium hunanense]MBC3920225.1 hypothetical protein [Undibacterium hunanense]
MHGALRLGVGNLLGKQQLRASGYQMLTNARCQLVISDAQKVIRQCIKRQQNNLTSVSGS